MLAKTLSNKDKQKVLPKHWTWIRFGDKKLTKFKSGVKLRKTLESTIQFETPAVGCPSIITLKFCRYPGTSKADYTGHQSILLDPKIHAGKTFWVTLSHSIITTPLMPVGLGIEHNGAGTLVLDGRQFKMN